jgi:hypothetical protein
VWWPVHAVRLAAARRASDKPRPGREWPAPNEPTSRQADNERDARPRPGHVFWHRRTGAVVLRLQGSRWSTHCRDGTKQTNGGTRQGGAKSRKARRRARMLTSILCNASAGPAAVSQLAARPQTTDQTTQAGGAGQARLTAGSGPSQTSRDWRQTRLLGRSQDQAPKQQGRDRGSMSVGDARGKSWANESETPALAVSRTDPLQSEDGYEGNSRRRATLGVAGRGRGNGVPISSSKEGAAIEQYRLAIKPGAG